MALQFSDIVEFLLIQAVAFVICTFLRLLYNIVLEKRFDYNLPLRNYRDDFSEIIRLCFLKSLSSLWEILKSFPENTQTRSFDQLETPFQDSSRCPTEGQLENTYSQNSSSNTTGNHSPSKLSQDSSSNITSDHLQSTPSQDESSSPAEDPSLSVPYPSSSSYALGIQSAISAHNRILRSTNRQLLTANKSLRPQRSGIQRNSK